MRLRSQRFLNLSKELKNDPLISDSHTFVASAQNELGDKSVHSTKSIKKDK